MYFQALQFVTYQCFFKPHIQLYDGHFGSNVALFYLEELPWGFPNLNL
jgi:hypothetical protein